MLAKVSAQPTATGPRPVLVFLATGLPAGNGCHHKSESHVSNESASFGNYCREAVLVVRNEYTMLIVDLEASFEP